MYFLFFFLGKKNVDSKRKNAKGDWMRNWEIMGEEKFTPMTRVPREVQIFIVLFFFSQDLPEAEPKTVSNELWKLTSIYIQIVMSNITKIYTYKFLVF